MYIYIKNIKMDKLIKNIRFLCFFDFFLIIEFQVNNITIIILGDFNFNLY